MAFLGLPVAALLMTAALVQPVQGAAFEHIGWVQQQYAAPHRLATRCRLATRPFRAVRLTLREDAARVTQTQTRNFGSAHLLGYLWPATGATSAKLRVLGALTLLLAAKLFIVRVPFVFKRCIDSLSSSTTSLVTPGGWMLSYALSRAVYTLLQGARSPASCGRAHTTWTH